MFISYYVSCRTHGFVADTVCIPGIIFSTFPPMFSYLICKVMHNGFIVKHSGYLEKRSKAIFIITYAMQHNTEYQFLCVVSHYATLGNIYFM